MSRGLLPGRYSSVSRTRAVRLLAMRPEPYATLAEVYEWLVPDPMVTPEGSVEAFDRIVDELGPDARVLDCAAGTGELAVGLRLKGFDVTATDASRAMIERTRNLAAARGVALRVAVCSWEQLVEQGWSNGFDAVWCVGNSIAHAPGRAARRAALGQMAEVLRPGGLLVLTSRNWELVRGEGSGLKIGEQLVERDGRRALVVYGWSLADNWGDRHHLDIAVAIVEPPGKVSSHVERLAFWPFRHEDLDADIRAAGLVRTLSTYDPTVDRYLVTAKLPGQ
jgi:SAM-dependent methyltransferase